MSKKAESEERTQLGYRLSITSRERLEQILKSTPPEMGINLSTMQEAIIMAFLASHPPIKDQEIVERLVIKLRRGELKLADEEQKQKDNSYYPKC